MTEGHGAEEPFLTGMNVFQTEAVHWPLTLHRVVRVHTSNLFMYLIPCDKLTTHSIMVTMRIEKKTTHGYIIGVWRFIELICILEFAQIPSKLFEPSCRKEHPLNGIIFSLHDALITDGCFTGIESWSPKHDTIKGFPWNWYIKGKLIIEGRSAFHLTGYYTLRE